MSNECHVFPLSAVRQCFLPLLSTNAWSIRQYDGWIMTEAGMTHVVVVEGMLDDRVRFALWNVGGAIP